MAPPANGNFLKPTEEEWREVFNRLSERFPSVPGQRIAQILRERNGHAGEAAGVLRDITGCVVKEADPDDVEHVATLLSSAAMFKHACKEQFRKFDVNKDGVLEWDEVKQLVNNLYDEFGLQSPSEGALQAFFHATDENADGVLSEREFRKFFEMFLRYSFFDHLKLRQMVEKGQAIAAERLQDGNSGKPARQVREDTEVVSSSPQESRASSPSEGSKPDKIKDDRQATPSKSNPKLAPLEQSKPAGRKSPPAGQEREKQERRRPREDREKDSAVLQGSSEASSSTAMRCLALNGVAYRSSPDFQDRKETVCGRGDTVRVLEHWIRTPDGWLPVTDQQGQSLFERTSIEPESKTDVQKKRVSWTEEQIDDGQVDVSARSLPSADADEAGGAELKSGEEEWRPALETLSKRFPKISQGKIIQALRENDGHAGKAASLLRFM